MLPTWAIVLIIIGSILILEIIIFAFIHPHLIKAIFKRGPFPRAPKWHVWIPKKYRVQ